MKKKSPVLLCTTFFLLGVVLGFLFAPIKNGVSIGNNSGNNSANVYDGDKAKAKINQ